MPPKKLTKVAWARRYGKRDLGGHHENVIMM